MRANFCGWTRSLTFLLYVLRRVSCEPQFLDIDPLLSLLPSSSSSYFYISDNMTTFMKNRSGWHPGEAAMHKMLRVERQTNPTSGGLPMPYAYRVTASPLVAVGALDTKGRPWTTVWGGEAAFARPIAQSVLGMQSLVDLSHDPVVDALFPDAKKDGQMVRPQQQPGEKGPLMAGLSIDLENRDRVKLAGTLIAGAVAKKGDREDIGEVQVAFGVEESLGNCPKYLNKKAIRPHLPNPKMVSESLPLPQEALDLLDRADLFFLSSTDGKSMDTNHRGGSPGLIRVISNSATDGVILMYPEFSGNRLYQTLGNLHVKPWMGICVPDFETGDALYITGETKILVGEEASSLMPHTKLAVCIHVTEAKFVRDSLPFRGSFIDYSPYNPPVRHLVTESTTGQSSNQPVATAVLTGRKVLTPTIARFTFKLQVDDRANKQTSLKRWKAGQYMTLDFAPELDVGWSHMRDEDPQSLNDDFVRTFTISSSPEALKDGQDAGIKNGTVLEMTLRKHGPATSLLWRQNLRVPLEIPVLGLGGDPDFQIVTAEGDTGTTAVFVAGGVGITPLLAQASGVLAAGVPVQVLWSLRWEDLPLAVDTFERLPGLARHVRLFMTGSRPASGDSEEALDKVKGAGAEIAIGRLTEEAVLSAGRSDKGRVLARRKYYLCTGQRLLKDLMVWLADEKVASESFNY